MTGTYKIKVDEVQFNREYAANGRVTYYFDLRTDNDDLNKLQCQFSTNKKDQTKFEIGKMYDVTSVEKSNSRGIYNFIDKVKTDPPAGSGSSAPAKSYSSGSSWVRSRADVISIISQSSYEAAILMSEKVCKVYLGTPNELALTHVDVSKIATQLASYVIETSGLNSEAAKKGDKDALKTANESGIIHQKAIKLAIQCLVIDKFNSTLPTNIQLLSVPGLIALTEMIYNDLKSIANGF